MTRSSAVRARTLGRNILSGPLSRIGTCPSQNFSLSERQKIRFTADMFDIWNHPVFSSPAFTDVQNPAAFGQIISTEITAHHSVLAEMVILRTREICEDPEQMNPGEPALRACSRPEQRLWVGPVCHTH